MKLLSAPVHELSTASELDFGHCTLWSRISLERIEQSTMGKRRYKLRCFPLSMKTNLVNFGPLTEKMTLTFDLRPWNSLGFVQLSRNMFTQKFHPAKCSGSWVIVRTEKKNLGRTQYSPSLPRGRS